MDKRKKKGVQQSNRGRFGKGRKCASFPLRQRGISALIPFGERPRVMGFEGGWAGRVGFAKPGWASQQRVKRGLVP